MSKLSLLVAIVFFVALFGAYCAPAAEEAAPAEETSAAEPESQAKTAIANLQATEGNTANGTVNFEEADGLVSIHAHITGLTPGKHGFHIHGIGDCSAADGTSAGGHFNPEETEHGSPAAELHHSGDLGNVEADEEGNAHLSIGVDFITLSEGPSSILGRAVIVHAKEDDFGQPTGNAGPRVACGVILGL